eukprot:9287459-Ditylum_brightwellii.AAC.3
MFDTIQHLRSICSNVLDSSLFADKTGKRFLGNRGISYKLFQHPTHLVLFDTFMAELETQMGKDVRPNVGLDYRILHIILSQIEEKLMN